VTAHRLSSGAVTSREMRTAAQQRARRRPSGRAKYDESCQCRKWEVGSA
jgi:hypothetical protein